MLELQIAAAPVRAAIPADLPLVERLRFAMRYVREHESAVFWMSGKVSEETMFRTALAAVALAGSEEDRRMIQDSLLPLKMLVAAMQGVPVDFSAMPADDDMLPLNKLWHESQLPITKAPAV